VDQGTLRLVKPQPMTLETGKFSVSKIPEVSKLRYRLSMQMVHHQIRLAKVSRSHTTKGLTDRRTISGRPHPRPEPGVELVSAKELSKERKIH
jgi:hypothetical protein